MDSPDPSTLDALAMALNCARRVRAAAIRLADPASTSQAYTRNEDVQAAAAARVGGSLALIAMAQDIRRVVDLLTDARGEGGGM